jgi:hypothetical protein
MDDTTHVTIDLLRPVGRQGPYNHLEHDLFNPSMYISSSIIFCSNEMRCLKFYNSFTVVALFYNDMLKFYRS